MSKKAKEAMTPERAAAALMSLVEDGFLVLHPDGKVSITEKGSKEARRLQALAAQMN